MATELFPYIVIVRDRDGAEWKIWRNVDGVIQTANDPDTLRQNAIDAGMSPANFEVVTEVKWFEDYARRIPTVI